MQTLTSFPTISDELKGMIRYRSTSFTFSYQEGGEDHELVAEDNGSSVRPLVDEHHRWTPDSFGLRIGRTYRINSASFLFGEKGVACSDAELGLALVWKSSDSRQRSAVDLGAILNSNEEQTYTLDKPFSEPRFRGRLELQTVIVVRKAGHPGENEEFLANIPGTILGVLDSFSVLFDGNGSMFPVSYGPNPGGLLWSVDCNFDDPTTAIFDADTVSINLNTSHGDYKYINMADKANFNPALLKEILADAVATIVDCARESSYWDDIRNGKSEEGSVGEAIHYFLKVLDLDLDNPRLSSISMRTLFEQKLAGL